MKFKITLRNADELANYNNNNQLYLFPPFTFLCRTLCRTYFLKKKREKSCYLK